MYLHYRERTVDFFDIIKFRTVPEIEPDSADNAGIILGHMIDNTNQGLGICMIFQENGRDALPDREVE